MFIHILIGLKKSDNYIDDKYLRIIGFDNIGRNYLQKIDYIASLKNTKVYDYELKASLIYDLINNTNTYEFEIKNKPVIKD